MLSQKTLEAIRERVEGVPDLKEWRDSIATLVDPTGIYQVSTPLRRASKQADKDAKFIAHAPTDILALLDHVALLESMLGDAHDESACYRQGFLDGQQASKDRAGEALKTTDDPGVSVLAHTTVLARMLHALEPVPYEVVKEPADAT